MILSDMGRDNISALQWKIGELVSGILLDYGIVVSLIVENRSYFLENQEILPFFRNIHQDGIRIGA